MRPLWPKWRLPNGVVNANEGSLEKSVELLDKWVLFCGLLLIFGLISEVALAIIHPPYDSFAGIWGGTLSDALVTLGVGGELLFGHKASLRVQELTRRAKKMLGEANERANAAALETERLRAQFSWRRLSKSQIKLFSDALANKAPLSIHITYAGADPEANTFARDIATLFRSSGWKVGFTSASYAGEVAFGLRLPLYAQPDLEACALARAALSAASIEYSGSEPPRWFMGNGSGEEAVGPCAHLYVGPKPAPSHELSDTGQPMKPSGMSAEEAKTFTATWRSRLQGDDPIMTWPIDSPLTISREDDGTLLIDCRNFYLAGLEEAGIARFRISPEAANELSQYFQSLAKQGDNGH